MPNTNSSNRNNGPIEYKIVSNLGVITAYKNGWNKELCLVEWNGGRTKFDIRDWDPDHANMSRGITLYEEEMKKIYDLLGDYFSESSESAAVLNAPAAVSD